MHSIRWKAFSLFLLGCHAVHAAWHQATQGGIHTVAIAGDASTVWMGTSGHGVFKSTDTGATWMRTNEGRMENQIKSLAVFNGRLFATIGSTFHRSQDSGRT